MWVGRPSGSLSDVSPTVVSKQLYRVTYDSFVLGREQITKLKQNNLLVSNGSCAGGIHFDGAASRLACSNL